MLRVTNLKEKVYIGIGIINLIFSVLKFVLAPPSRLAVPDFVGQLAFSVLFFIVAWRSLRKKKVTGNLLDSKVL